VTEDWRGEHFIRSPKKEKPAEVKPRRRSNLGDLAKRKVRDPDEADRKTRAEQRAAKKLKPGGKSAKP